MSNQCSNLFNYRSFNLFPLHHTPLKPYATTLRPVFPFHGNLILTSRRSGNRTSSLPPPLAAQSSSDVILVATKEHHDGSLIFQFGDASEVVKNVEVVKEIESKDELESNVVKVIDEGQVVEKIEGDSVSDISRLTEVADKITNADIDSEIAESETNASSDLRDYHAESIEILSYIPEEEVVSFQLDANLIESLEGKESTLDNESLNSTISLVDNSLNLDKSADSLSKDDDDDDDGSDDVLDSIKLESMQASDIKLDETESTLQLDGEGESEDQLVSVKLESMQDLDIEVMDVKQPYVKDELQMVEIEDVSESNTEDFIPPTTMEISVVELTNVANEDVNEELQEMNVNGATVIDEIPPSDPVQAESLDEVSELQSVDIKVEETMEVLSTEAMVVKDLGMENELQEVSTNKSDENDVEYVIPVSCLEENKTVVIEPQLTTIEVKPDVQVSDNEVNDSNGENLEDVILQTNDETEDVLVSVKLETVQVEVMDGTETDELPKVELNVTDLLPQDDEIMDTEKEDMEEGLQDMIINESSFIDEIPPSDPSGSDSTLDDLNQLPLADVKLEETMEVSATKEMDVKDQSLEDELKQVSYYNIYIEVEEEETISEEEEVSQVNSVSLELKPTMEVLDIELENDTVSENLDDEILQVIDETEDVSESVKLEDVMQVSNIEVTDELPEVETEDAGEIDVENLMGVLTTMDNSDVEVSEAVNEDFQEVLEDMSMGSLLDGMLPIEATKDVKDLGVEDELQEDNSDEDDVAFVMPEKLSIDEEVSQPCSTPVEHNKPTMEISDSEGQNVDDVEVSEAVNEDVEQVLEDMSFNESNGMLPSDVLETEPTSDVKDVSVENELQEVSSDDNDVVNVMPEELVKKEEVSQLCSTSIEVKPTMEVSDSEGEDLDDGILQVIDEDAGDSYIKDVEQLLHQLEAQLVQDNMLEQGSQLAAETIEDKVTTSELAETPEETAILLAKVEREESYLTGYFLSSGAALLELPFKALTGGDDAYFVSSSKWLGVANAVSQWSFEGTEPGVYAKELMKTCNQIVSNTTKVPISNPVDLLCRCVKETNMSGSSNILIANFNGQSLHVANIGDTGFLIIRHGTVYKKSSPLLHDFHFALQVEDRDDPLQLVEEHIIELEEGDIVVSATDGLFDNLYEPEIAMAVSKSIQDGMKPEEVAKVLATRAQVVGRSPYVRSPFSDAAQAAGYTGYTGGKQDNVAVIVSLVEKSSMI